MAKTSVVRISIPIDLSSRSFITDFSTPSDSGIGSIHVFSLDNLKGSVGSILAKTSVMRISIPIDLSSRSFITDFSTPSDSGTPSERVNKLSDRTQI